MAAEQLETRTLLTQSAVTVALNVSAEQSVVGDSVTYAARVRPADGSIVSPTGTATFFDRTTVGWIAVGADAGFAPQVDLLDQTGTRLLTLPQAYGSLFLGGVRVALGDVNGDGVAEVITAPGPGTAPDVFVYGITEGASGLVATQIAHFLAGDSANTSGVNIATGDVNGDGLADVVAAIGTTINVYSGADIGANTTIQPILTLGGFGTLVTSINIATGDVNEDGHSDVVVGTGLGSAPSIKVFDGMTGGSLFSFTPFEPAFIGGVSVATGDFNGDGHLEIVAAKGVGSTLVKFFNRTGTAAVAGGNLSEAPLQDGLQIVTADFDGNGRDDLVISTVLGTIGKRADATDYVPTAEFVFPGFGLGGVGGIRADVFLLRSRAPVLPSGIGLRTAFRAGNFAASASVFNHYLGELPLDVKGDAALTLSTLAPGVHLVHVRYSGDQIYLDGASKVVANGVADKNDFGDAPDTYGTSLFANGARHGAGGPKLGSKVDLETDGHPSANATGDDLAGPVNDEDGVTFMSNVMFSNDQSLTNTVTVNASSSGFLDAFIDFNRDGDFDDEAEKLQSRSIPVVAGENQITFVVPSNAVIFRRTGIRSFDIPELSLSAGDTFARFRISSAGQLSPTGAAIDGEVEDHRITLQDVSSGTGKSSPLLVQLPAHFQGNIAMPTQHDFVIANGLMTLFDVFQGGNRTPMFQVPYDAYRRIDIMGTAGDDTLRLDLSGSDVSFMDLFYDGGTQATATGDSLVIIGGGRKFDHWNMSYTDAKDGTISIDGSTIEFKDLEPINMTTIVDHATISISGGLNYPNVTAALVDAGAGVGRFSGLLVNADNTAGTPFETVNFVTPRLSMTVNLGTGNDRLSIESLPGGFDRASLTIRGNGGNDAIRAVSSIGGLPLNTPVTLDGGAGNDTLEGGNRSDLLIGGTGDDSLNGGDGNDSLQGDEGYDLLVGANGDDQLTGGRQVDSLYGGAGNDTLTLGLPGIFGIVFEVVSSFQGEVANGEEGNDVINGDGASAFQNQQLILLPNFFRGGTGDDTIHGSLFNPSQIDGDAGNDVLYGLSENSVVRGGLGDDRIYAGAQSTVDGGEGNDIIEATGRSTLNGGSGADRITGSFSHDLIDGGTGDDSIDGGDGNDDVTAGSGDDVVHGNNGHDTIDGGDGIDRLFGDLGDDSVLGGNGDDRITGDAGNDSLSGGDGRDVIDGGIGNDQLLGGEDNDTINGGAGNDLITGDGDNDSLLGGDGNDTVSGGLDDDTVQGGNGDDSVSGGDGDDRVLGQAGNDTVTAGDGVDTIDGGIGNDAISEMTLNATLTPTRLTLVNLDGDTEIETLRGIERAILSAELSPAGVTLNASAFRGSVTLIGSAFNDTITSGSGADSINGGSGNDSIIAGAGNDTINGGDGNDTIRGGDGNDSIKGGADNDSLNGGGGNDLLNGGTGNDVLEGDTDSQPASAGNDSLTGQDGDDTLRGFGGNDVLVGGNGNDSLEGGAGKDILLGEAGNDTLVGGADLDVMAGGGGVNVFTSAVAGEINEAFMFLGGRPLWIDEI